MIKENKMYYSSKPGLIAALALGNFSSPSRIIFCNNANRVMISDSFSGKPINFRQAIIDRSAAINATLAEPLRHPGQFRARRLSHKVIW